MSPSDRDDETSRIRWSTEVLSILMGIGSLATAGSWYMLHGQSYWQWNLAASFSAAAVGVVTFYKRLPVWICETITILLLGLALFANVMTNYQLAITGVSFQMFAAFRLIPLVIAVLSPRPAWLAYSVISLCIVGPIVLFFLFFAHLAPGVVPVQEPWITVIYALIGGLILYYRRKGIAAEQEMARMKAQRRALDDLARIFLGLRDLTNTPIQAIELTSELLGTEAISSAEGHRHLQRSLIQLRLLSQILASYEKDVDWSNTESTFNASALLQIKLEEIKGR